MSTPARRVESMTADQFRGWVVATACAHGWLVSEATTGPDLWLVRGGAVLAVLVKAERGKVTEPQQEWLDDLGPTPVTGAVWKPSQMPAVFAQLTVPNAREDAA